MKAIIPVAGLGTRLFPATRVVPKPFFPLIDPRDGATKPAIHLIVDEAVRAGIDQVCVVINPCLREKMEEYFSSKRAPVNNDFSNAQLAQIHRLAKHISFIEQKEPLGFGHAIYCAQKFIGNEYFMVLLGDHVYSHAIESNTCAGDLMSAYKVTRKSITSVGTCKESELGWNGILKCAKTDMGQILSILDMVEKPLAHKAKSSLTSDSLDGEYFCNFGIDILSPSIFNILDKNIFENKANNNEIQLRHSMKELWKYEGLDAFYEKSSRRFDLGIPTEYRKTMIDYSIAYNWSRANSYSCLEGPLSTQINSFVELIKKKYRNFFGGFKQDVIIARAPGRLDVMGGIADYSGCTVLQLPTTEATLVAIQSEPLGSSLKICRVVSHSQNGEINEVSATLHSLSQFSNMNYKEINAYFKTNFNSSPWVAYICGVIIVLGKEIDKTVLQSTIKLVVDSTVPESKGVSSSAAIEVAVAQAIVGSFNLTIDNEKLAVLCQKAENLIVGAACGVMDQVASNFGKEHNFTSLICQPLNDVKNIPFSKEMAIWGLNSGISRSVAGVSYTNTRIGAFMGHRIITSVDNCQYTMKDNTVEVVNDQWKGYLSNISPEIFESKYQQHIPVTALGSEFLLAFHGSVDSITKIDTYTTYNVLNATKHPIYENHRIKRFISTLNDLNQSDGKDVEEKLESMGKAMYESHASYSTCGMGSPQTDLLVNLVREEGIANDLYGARVTGGGGGGTVVVMGKNTSKAKAALQKIQHKYQLKTGIFPHLFSGSSMGAADFGTIVLQKW